MDLLTPECAVHSVGPANQLFGLLIQTILAAQCAMSPKDMWPKDYGPTAVEQGNFYQCFVFTIIEEKTHSQSKTIIPIFFYKKFFFYLFTWAIFHDKFTTTRNLSIIDVKYRHILKFYHFQHIFVWVFF